MKKNSNLIVKWNNGYWKVFDTQQYTDVAMFGLKKEAEAFINKF
jgi:hypothetical protein